MNLQHDAAGRRFVASGEDGEGFLSYAEIAPGVLELHYIEVPPRFRGQGVAGEIVRAFSRWARENRVRVIPTCPYIMGWFRRHPEERDLLFAPDQSK